MAEAATATLNKPAWVDLATTDPKASYQSDATFTDRAANICERNIAW